MEKKYTGQKRVKIYIFKVIVYPTIMVFKRGKNRLTAVDFINSNNIKDKFSTLFNTGQALIRIYFLIVSFEKLVEK